MLAFLVLLLREKRNGRQGEHNISETAKHPVSSSLARSLWVLLGWKRPLKLVLPIFCSKQSHRQPSLGLPWDMKALCGFVPLTTNPGTCKVVGDSDCRRTYQNGLAFIYFTNAPELDTLRRCFLCAGVLKWQMLFWLVLICALCYVFIFCFPFAVVKNIGLLCLGSTSGLYFTSPFFSTPSVRTISFSCLLTCA